ncbi:MAG: IS66 family transposase [Solirubrobacteraceae bacterium]
MSDASRDAQRPSYGELEERLAQRDARIGELEREIAELRARLDQNSRNSSRPPSSDGYRKPSADSKGQKKSRSLRKRSGRKPGGQDGHEGVHLARRDVVDDYVWHEPQGCSGCGGDLAGAERVAEGESRQVLDLPEEIVLLVIEHVTVVRRCACCGRINVGCFPEGVEAPVQYGPRVRALGVYVIVFQHIPYERATQLIFELADVHVSTGTLKAWVDQAAAGLTEFDEQLRELLAGSPVCHFDETGARIAGRLGWIHSTSTTRLTRYTAHARRGTQAMDDAGVLPEFHGVAVHDGWKPYQSYSEATHALCGAHHLRELQAAIEAGHAWANPMSTLLADAAQSVEQAKAKGATALSARALRQIHRRYRDVIATGYRENSELADNATKKTKRTKAENLLLRLDTVEDDALRFAHDFRVPFTNNLAEQDIRMAKLQLKISGCWRTDTGAQRYLKIRSYLSTARKHHESPLAVLNQLTAGQPWMPPPAPA